MDDKHIQILQKALGLFIQFGVKSQTMEDIASNMGMSKKTLYQFVKNKEDLVTQTLTFFINQHKAKFSEILKGNGNAIDKFITINKLVSKQLQEVHPSVLFDIQKYYPAAWKILREFKFSFISDLIKENLNQGIAEGLYRDNLNVEVITFMYTTMADNLFSHNHLSIKYSIAQLHKELVRYHIRGIAGEKGIHYLLKKLNHDNEQLF